MSEHTLYIAIVGCEVAFWLLLFAGLGCRYVWHRKRLSTWLLWCVPLIDVALLGLTVVDLHRGANATFAHGLATAYVGFTIAFGPLLIQWADQRFAHRFGEGPAPYRPPSRGWASVLHELRLWARCLFAVCITYLLLSAIITFIDRPSQTQALNIWYRIPLGTAFFWFIFGPLWQLIFLRREPKAS